MAVAKKKTVSKTFEGKKASPTKKASPKKAVKKAVKFEYTVTTDQTGKIVKIVSKK